MLKLSPAKNNFISKNNLLFIDNAIFSIKMHSSSSREVKYIKRRHSVFIDCVRYLICEWKLVKENVSKFHNNAVSLVYALSYLCGKRKKKNQTITMFQRVEFILWEKQTYSRQILKIKNVSNPANKMCYRVGRILIPSLY